MNIRGELEQKQQEAEANYFARSLLVPKVLLDREVEKLPAGRRDLTKDQTLIALAKTFQVPLFVMAQRIIECGYAEAYPE